MSIDNSTQKHKAQNLLTLHRQAPLLVLPNVWNPIGARVLQAQGYPAVATASAAISASLGYQDGEKLKRSTLIDLIGRIAHSVDVPVSADIEAGYGRSTHDLDETINEVIDSGVVGVNIEDSFEEEGVLRPVEEQCRRISVVRQVADRRGIPLVINARVDSFLSSSFGDYGDATEDAVTRARAYAEAGADCIYPIGPGDEETARVLRARIELPINILVTPTAAPLKVLETIGVNRVSFGPFLFRSCLRKFIDIAETLLNQGDCSCISDMLSKAETAEYLIDGNE
jgi:2-methylisocitrate lyase-like PEP mutase family enzyme